MNYNYSKKRVSQVINTIDLYDLEGDFSHAIKKLEEEYKYYQDNYTQLKRLKGNYNDGCTIKFVKFDSFRLVVDRDCENEKILVVRGERDFLPEEIEAYQNQLTKTEAYEREQLAKLKAKYEKPVD